MFINHRQEQWPEWLGTTEFAYNNKIYLATKVSSFKANCGQNPRMGFEERKWGKYKAARNFVKRMKRIQEKARAVLGKAQEEMKWYTDRERSNGEQYRVEDLVMMSTKDLKQQMKEKRTEKLTEQYVGSYKVKKVISPNAIKLILPTIVKIHLVVNVSRVWLYKPQVKGQKVVLP